MEIQQLKGFHAVAKYRNFTIAAQKTHRTQPTISLQVKSLEDELGVKLFERLGPKKVNLTQEGQIFLELSAPLLQDFTQLQSKFNEARGQYHTSNVQIATHSSVMIYLLPKIIKKFKSVFPQVKLSILNRTRKELVSMVEHGEVDFGISSLDAIPPSLEYDIFSIHNRILIANKEHPLASRSNISLSDIAKYPLVVPTPDSNTRKFIDRAFSQEDINYEITMEVVGRTAIKTYVGMDLGISIINEYYVTEEDKKNLFVKNMSKHFGKAETGVLFRKGRTISQPAEAFISLLKKMSANI
ncbi:MAG TPA: LysR substrate-binding domain-containing protein [Oligoflexia bacterium]|nr:LysR substrate-binding domain-containing protein [Oligoflexia bacterium]HMP48702.1 LysR substrate-binding domain-containing protein [Oligoflexia bacterium]